MCSFNVDKCKTCKYSWTHCGQATAPDLNIKCVLWNSVEFAWQPFHEKRSWNLCVTCGVRQHPREFDTDNAHIIIFDPLSKIPQITICVSLTVFLLSKSKCLLMNIFWLPNVLVFSKCDVMLSVKLGSIWPNNSQGFPTNVVWIHRVDGLSFG